MNELTANPKDTKIKRRKRVPLDEQRRLTSVKQEEGYMYRWVNDSPNRIQMFRDAGYELVDLEGHDLVDPDKRMQDPSWRQSVVSQFVGQGIVAYLMRIPREWYDEDQKKKQDKIDAQEKSTNLLRSKDVSDKDFYGEIEIKHSRHSS